jgi:uncharacterized membrane protein
MNKLRQLWSNLRSSFWFMPSLMVVASIAFAAVMIEADSAGSDRWLARWPRLFGVGAEGARDMLSTLAGSMMSIMGVTFSMTLVALALASSQNTSRILRNFMRSRVTQCTLGVFAGIFAYCLIVLRTIRSGDAEFVPSLAVFFAFVLALGGIGVLVYFIHHIASSIQASSIIASVAHETIASIDRLFPEKLGHGPDEDEDQDQVLRSLEERTWRAVPAEMNGYIQSVDNDALLRLARDRKTIVRMERGIGAFIVQNTALASLAMEGPPDQETIAALNGSYSISRHRTVEQDPAFGIRQIVDMALKALSPGVNEEEVAMTDKRKAFEEKLDAQMKEWNVQIALLKAKAENAKADAKVEYYAKIEALQHRRDTARAKLQELKAAGDGAWEDLKTGAEKAWAEVKTAFHDAVSKFK